MPSAARKHFEVRSARNAEFFRSIVRGAAISITSGHEHPVVGEANRVGLLRLVFERYHAADTPQSFTPALATEILGFVAACGTGRSVPDPLRRGAVEIAGRRGRPVPHLLRRRRAVVRVGLPEPPGLRSAC